MSWDDLQHLLALEREGSLAAAARALRVDASTVSRRVAALEKRLGVRLVLRTPDGLVLTSAGKRAAETAGAIEAQVALLAGGVSASDERAAGVVRVSTTETFTHVLMRAFTDLRAHHPELTVDVAATNSLADLRRGEADVAVRMQRETRAGLVARKLGTVGWSLFGSAQYVARRGRLRRVTDLAGHELVTYDGSLAKVPGPRWLAEHAKGAHAVMRCSSPRAAATAAVAGVGMTILPCYIAAFEPTLVRLAPDVLATSEVFSVIAPDSRSVRRVGAVVDHLAAFMTRERAWLAGDMR